MQPLPTRTRLNSSVLVGLLAELALVDEPPAPPSFVEGLALWLGWKEAIPLSAALHAPLQAPLLAPLPSPLPTPPPATNPPAAAKRPGGRTAPAATTPQPALAAEFRHVRQSLEHDIANTASTAMEDGASFVPFRRRCFGLQQAMEARIAPLRRQLRAGVAALPEAATARLAALDGAMADALAAREQALLAQMPVLLEKHFARLRQAAAPAWLATFSRDMQRLLLAELDLRLQPAQGLLDTLLAAHPHTATS